MAADFKRLPDFQVVGEFVFVFVHHTDDDFGKQWQLEPLGYQPIQKRLPLCHGLGAGSHHQYDELKQKKNSPTLESPGGA